MSYGDIMFNAFISRRFVRLCLDSQVTRNFSEESMIIFILARTHSEEVLMPQLRDQERKVRRRLISASASHPMAHDNFP